MTRLALCIGIALMVAASVHAQGPDGVNRPSVVGLQCIGSIVAFCSAAAEIAAESDGLPLPHLSQ